MTTFKDLARDWLTAIGGAEVVVFAKRADGGYTLAAEQLGLWQRYHEDHTELRLLDHDVHRVHTRAQQTQTQAKLALTTESRNGYGDPD